MGKPARMRRSPSREAGEDEIAHVVLRTFVDGDAVDDVPGFFVELRFVIEGRIEEARLTIGGANALPDNFDLIAIGGRAGLQVNELIEIR